MQGKNDNSADEKLENIEIQKLTLAEVVFDQFLDRFRWLLDRACLQVKSFGGIISEAISGFYSDMKDQQDQYNCMYNLMISEIFQLKKFNQKKVVKDMLFDPNQKQTRIQCCDLIAEELNQYNGIYLDDSQTLYHSVRNLFCLAYRQDSLSLIAKIMKYQIFISLKKQNPSLNLDDPFKLYE